MSGLLSGFLPAVYSGTNRLQNKLAELLRDPMGVAAQTAGGIQDEARQQEALMGSAFANPKRPLQVTNPQALGQASERMMAGLMGFAPAGITVWHGSPHAFNKFDSSKIGTGEGAQAYGHGLYLAESPDVAGKYATDLAASRQSLTNRGLNRVGGDIDAAILATKAEIDRLQSLPNGGGDPQKMKRFVALNEEKLAELTKLKAGQEMSQPNLYKVDLPDEAIAKMLDWDKPLSQQSKEVQKAIKDRMALGDKFNFDERATGEQIYKQLTQDPTNRASADELKWMGIPGIRYLDGGSRGTGQGTSNFVVFPGNENMLTILERNNKPVNKLADIINK